MKDKALSFTWRVLAWMDGVCDQSRTSAIDLQLYTDVMVSHNRFEREPGIVSTQDMAIQSNYGTCVDNVYSQPGILCAPSTLPSVVFFRREPDPIAPPSA